MIVLILRGGLGNQMFEYAAAKSMALRAHTEVILNTSLGFATDYEFHRKFCLDCFSLSYSKNRLLSFDFIGGHFFEALSRKLGFHVLAPHYKVINDTNTDVADLKNNPSKYKNVLLTGTWNGTDDYFNDMFETIKIEFNLIWDLPPLVKQYEELIHLSIKPVVAVGIRLFQEVKNGSKSPDSQKAPEADYIHGALEWYNRNFGDVKFLVFTQVKDWFLNNIQTEIFDFEFVDTYTDDSTAIFDMYLFSICDHYILTNSTFYAWGEKLGRNSNKCVVIPDNWNLSTNKSWIKLSKCNEDSASIY